jgi:lipid II:glycine glycyltransferase (peptidoglycan interpeptide bridge formation enzyme)
MAKILDQYSSVLQTKEWSDFKANFGWRAHHIKDVWILEKKIALGRSVLYIPEVTKDKLTNLNLEELRALAKKTGAIFLKVEPLCSVGDTSLEQFLTENKFIKSFEELQPNSRIILNIEKDHEQILKQMKPKGRYNINLAKRKNLKIVSGKSQRELKNFYKLFVETSRRDGFTPRARMYFQKLIDTLGNKGWAQIYIAYHNHVPLASVIATFYQGTATYLYGASSLEGRPLMAPYLLHWQIIQDAKSKGCSTYDFLAVSPSGVKKHKYDGITQFKEKFGGERVELAGSWDLVFTPWLYKTYKLVESQRRGL